MEGLLSRGDRRVAKVIRRSGQDGARFDGWSEYFSFERWERCAAARRWPATAVDLAWYTTREREYDEVLPWDHLDAGLDRDWLWQDWQAAIDPAGAAEVEDCRWTPCFECGVCPAMGTEIETGPTGQRLLPLTAGRASRRRDRVLMPVARPPPVGRAAAPAVQRLIVRYAKRGRMRFASHRDIARAVERGVRRAGLPVAYSAGFSPHPKISYAGGAPTGAASEAEYLEISLTGAAPHPGAERLDAALPDGIDVIEVVDRGSRPGAAALEASRGRSCCPGWRRTRRRGQPTAFLAADAVEVDRLTSKGIRRLDTRAAVVTLEADRRAAEGRTPGVRYFEWLFGT